MQNTGDKVGEACAEVSLIHGGELGFAFQQKILSHVSQTSLSSLYIWSPLHLATFRFIYTK